ncbi:MAG: GNAT family N-acetyltransferase [Flavobacteriaceae bacterium]
MKLEGIFLRALEPEDLEVLLQLENDSSLWKYSNRTEPFSRDLLQKYIDQQHQDIFEVKQKRFVVSYPDQTPIGFVDLFDFEPLHRRAGIGVIIHPNYQGKGYARRALELVEEYAKKQLNLHSLYANIAEENSASLKVFESCEFRRIAEKKEWNFYEGRFHDEYLYQKLLS